jgi:N-acetylglucosamine-6-phosphate deacetylase
MDPSLNARTEVNTPEFENLLVLHAENVYTHSGNYLSAAYVVIKNGIIVSVGESLPTDIPSSTPIIEGNWIAPGFVDLHNHGCGGMNKVEEYWLSDYSATNHIKYGTTSTLASLTFSENTELTKSILESLNNRIGKVIPNQTVIEGIHAEGPLIRSRGALPPCKDLSDEEFKEFVDSMPMMKVMTISPSLEAPLGYSRMKYLFEKNILVSIGHDNETKEDEILGVLKLAHKYQRPVHVTHLFNVTKFHHRDVGLVNIALLSQFPEGMEKYSNMIEPSVEIIGDFVHVHPLVVQLALQTKNIEKICFITDAIADGNDKSMFSFYIQQLYEQE